MSTDKLPYGWARVKFGDVVRNVNDNSRDLAADRLDRVVGLDHLDPGSLRLDRWDNREDLPDGTTFTRRFKPGQVLFGKRRAYQRKVAVPDFEGVCSGDILVFEPADERMLAEYLPHVVQSDGFFDLALGTSAGSLSPRTKWAELAKYEFALPPIAEQKEIADILNASSEYLRSCQVTCSASNVLLQSIVRAAVVDSPTVELAVKAEVELGKKRDPKLLREGSAVPYLRAANVKPARFDLSDVMEMNFTDSERSTFELRPGDVLVTEGCGSLSQVGACATWRGELSGAVCFQMTLLRLRARDPDDAGLLSHWAQYAFATGDFARVASGTSVFHLSAARVRRMRLPDLDIERKRLLVRQMDAVGAVTHSAELAIESALVLHRALRERLLMGGAL